MKMVKKVLAFVLAAAMVLSLAACGEKAPGTNKPTPAPSTDDGTINVQKDPTKAPEPTKAAETGTTDPVAEPTAEPTPEVKKEYTMNYALSVFPTNWNICQYQTATDNDDMLGYITAGFYQFDYNETKDGYKLVPDMAVGDPVDVTAQYVGKFGITEGEANRAIKITLRDDIKWEDGTKIGAADFVESAKLLLAPEAQNYRADMLYSGSLAIVNAKNYLYQGQYAYGEFVSAAYGDDEYVAISDFGLNENGQYTCAKGDVAVKLTSGGNWGSNGLAAYANAGYLTNTAADYEALQAAADEDGIVKLTPELYLNLSNCIAELHGYASAEAYAAAAGDYAYMEAQEMAICGSEYAATDFSEVGIFALSDSELVLVLEKPLKGFYLLYNLTGSWLVNADLYKKCESITDGVYTNSYCTSVETTISYGPYKLVSFQNDKQYILEKNEQCHALKDYPFQTTRIQYDYVAEPATRLELFLNGKLDGYGLQADDMKDYQSSDYTYYTTTPSTYFIALNPDPEVLVTQQEAAGANINKTILTIIDFRRALSYALDRKAFALAVSPTNNAAFAIYSDLIISNPETGESYRSKESAKKVIVKFWGVDQEIGAGKMYADYDEAIDSITGYNLAMAQDLFNKAYDQAIADGLLKDTDVVEIKIGLPNGTSNFYVKGYEYLVNCYTNAVKGTKLEGKLTFTKDDTLGNGFGDALRNNQVDMLFGVGWSGSALDPYGLIEAYTTEQYQYNKCWNTAEEDLTVTLNGVDYTASVLDWTNAISSGNEITITAADGTTTTFSAGADSELKDERFEVLAALEGAVLDTYMLLPMIDASSAALKGMQIEYYTEDYVYGVGRGGLRYNTFNYSDDEWDAFVASQGGTLNYK